VGQLGEGFVCGRHGGVCLQKEHFADAVTVDGQPDQMICLFYNSYL
jgi:hypothetical protein